MNLHMPHRLVRLGNPQLLEIFEAKEFSERRSSYPLLLVAACGRTHHRCSLNDSVTLRLSDRWINAMRSLSIEPCAEGMPGRGFPRYTLCAGSFGAADTKRRSPLDQRRQLG